MASLEKAKAREDKIAQRYANVYLNQLSDFGLSTFFPEFLMPADGPGRRLSGVYHEIPADQFLTLEGSSKLANHAPARVLDFEFQEHTFKVARYARKAYYNDDDVANYSSNVPVRRNKARRILHHLLLEKEQRYLAALQAIAAFQDLDSSGPNWDEANATPRDNVNAALASLDKTAPGPGLKLGVMASDVFYAITGDPSATNANAASNRVAEAVKYTMGLTGKNLTPQLLQNYFNLDGLVIHRSVVNTVQKGLTPVIGYQFSNEFIIGKVDSTPDIDSLTTGWTFTAKRLTDARGFVTWSDPDLGDGGTVIKGEEKILEKIVCAGAVKRLTNVLNSV